MKWENFESKIHPSWHHKLRPLIEGTELDAVYKVLKARSKAGARITPDSTEVWRAFLECRYENLKCVLVGMAPYHSLKGGELVADGLCMSCSHSMELQPSLEKYYDAIEKEVYDGFNLKMDRNPDLTFLARQGVLMLNSALTTEVGVKSAHKDEWFPFMAKLFEEVISLTGVPIIFMGNDAAELMPHVLSDQWKFKIEHPAASCYAKPTRDWNTQEVFKKVRDIIKDMNGFTLDWDDVIPPFDR